MEGNERWKPSTKRSIERKTIWSDKWLKVDTNRINATLTNFHELTNYVFICFSSLYVKRSADVTETLGAIFALSSNEAEFVFQTTFR